MAKAPNGKRIDMSYDPPKGKFYKVEYIGGTVYYQGYINSDGTILQGQAISCDSYRVAPVLPDHDMTYVVDPWPREEAEAMPQYWYDETGCPHEDFATNWIPLTKFIPAQEDEIFIEYDMEDD